MLIREAAGFLYMLRLAPGHCCSCAMWDVKKADAAKPRKNNEWVSNLVYSYFVFRIVCDGSLVLFLTSSSTYGQCNNSMYHSSTTRGGGVPLL